MKQTQFTQEQLLVVKNTQLLVCLFNSLIEISSNENYNLNRKRFLMFLEIVNYMRVRKGDLLLVGIKENVVDKIIRNELKTLEQTTKGVKNVIL